jgi:hypothetical protein
MKRLEITRILLYIFSCIWFVITIPICIFATMLLIVVIIPTLILISSFFNNFKFVELTEKYLFSRLFNLPIYFLLKYKK